jgi:hypothetical protein
MKIIASVLSLLIIIGLMFFKDKRKKSGTEMKFQIDGLSLVSPRFQVTDTMLKSVKEVNAEWVAVIPYAMTFKDSTSLIYDHERQWWGETKSGTIQLIEAARKNDLKIMLKPHIWVIRGKWVGEITFQTEEEWQIWENNYRKYILDFACLAEDHKVEMFCLGTELKQFVTQRPGFWRLLILECRKAYSGSLIYAANWDDYRNTQFWHLLDYIGIDAYFPLSKEKNPSLNELEDSWQSISRSLEKFSNKHQKNIIFTEYGYQGIDYGTARPWETNADYNVNLDLQNNTLNALYKCIWSENWFSGGFLWKWHLDPPDDSVKRRRDLYSPQNKPAYEVIKKAYLNYP